MKNTLIALALLAALPLSAQAAERSNTFVELNYSRVQSVADGFAARGSFEIADSGFYALAGYTNVDPAAIVGDGVDVDTWYVGGGYAYTLNDQFDLIGEGVYNRHDIAGLGDIDGHKLSAGARASFGEHLEALVKANYTETDLTPGQYSGTVGLNVKLDERISALTEVEFFERGNRAATVGVRFNF